MSNYCKIDKYLLAGILALLLGVIAAPVVLAAVEITSPEVVFTADYGDFREEDQQTARGTFDVSIKNTETTAVTVAVSIINLPSRYNAPAIPTVSIPAGETRTVSVAINVPHLQDSGRRQIGALEIRNTATNVLYDSAGLIQNTISMLEIDEIEADYVDEDGDSESQTFNGDSSRLRLDKGVQPGSELTISLKDIKNLFNNNYDEDSSEIEDIIITIEADNDDLFGDGFEEEYKLGILKAEKRIDFDLTLPIDEEAEEDEYTITLEIEGEDGEGVKHRIIKELILQLERSQKDLRITTFAVSPEKPTVCDDLQVNIKVKNLGTRLQDDVVIQLYSPTLEITENSPVLKLNRFSKSDNFYSKSFAFDLENKKIEPGRHDLELSVFVDDERADHELKAVVVEDCKETAEPVDKTNEQKTNEELTQTTETSSGDNNKNNIKQPEKNVISTGQVVRTVEDPYTNEDVLVSLIITTIIMLLAVIAIFTVILIKNKNTKDESKNTKDEGKKYLKKKEE